MARQIRRKRRKIEAHRLTISGLRPGTSYNDFLKYLRSVVDNDVEAVSYTIGGKTHALHSIIPEGNRTRFLFFSYSEQDRPDVLNTEDYSITESPLSDQETGIYWTHVVGGRNSKNDYILAIEKHQPGIWPSSIEKYLQWFVDEFVEEPSILADWSIPDEPLVISIEAVPSGDFVDRLEGMTRITRAVVRTVRPNPGWSDLEEELGREGSKSDAHKVDVSMSARRGNTLAKDEGIVQAIKDGVRDQTLDYAAIEGKEAGAEREPNVTFSTANMGKQTFKSVPVDSHGKLRRNDAWAAVDAAFAEFGQ